MNEVVGNFWDYAKEHQPQVLVCTTNGVIKSDGKLVMGKGIAKDFSEYFPDLSGFWGFKISKQYKDNPELRKTLTYEPWPMRLTSKKLLKGYRPIVYNLQTKTDLKKPSRIELVIASIIKLQEFCIKNRIQSVLMTRPGCGNGGLRWEDVRNYIPSSNIYTVINETI